MLCICFLTFTSPSFLKYHGDGLWQSCFFFVEILCVDIWHICYLYHINDYVYFCLVYLVINQVTYFIIQKTERKTYAFFITRDFITFLCIQRLLLNLLLLSFVSLVCLSVLLNYISDLNICIFLCCFILLSLLKSSLVFCLCLYCVMKQCLIMPAFDWLCFFFQL